MDCRDGAGTVRRGDDRRDRTFRSALGDRRDVYPRLPERAEEAAGDANPLAHAVAHQAYDGEIPPAHDLVHPAGVDLGFERRAHGPLRLVGGASVDAE